MRQGPVAAATGPCSGRGQRLTVNGPAVPPAEDSIQIVPGLAAGAAALRALASQTPPVSGGAAAVTGAVSSTRPPRLPYWTVMVAPTSEPVPVIRKSPVFHLAVPMVTRSGVGVTLTSSLRDSPLAVTVSRKVSGMLVMG